MKKIFLVGTLFSSLLFANASYYTSLPYLGYIKYTGTTAKKDGNVKGVYFSIFKSPWKVEFDVEGTTITYKDSTADLAQGDFSMFLTYYKGYNLAYNFGVHYIDSTDLLTDGGQVYKLGMLCYKSYEWNKGIDVYYSNYTNLSTSPKLIQISPKIGFNFGDYYSSIGSFYVETKIDYIKVLENQAINNLSKVYRSIDLTLNNYNGKFTTSFNGWVGKRSFAVENGGFIVNNIGDEQNGGFKIAEEYKVNKVQSFKLEYSYTKFKENGNSATRTYLLSFNYGF
jgi:hypothetical protein